MVPQPLPFGVNKLLIEKCMHKTIGMKK